MKTPRELLLSRHESAHADLDALREQVLAAEFGIKTRNPKPETRNHRPWLFRLPLKLWLELIRPAPRIWAGFASVWIAIAILRVADGDPSRAVAGPPTAIASAVFLEWKEQEKLLAEFNPPAPASPQPAEPAAPKPRSQRRSVWQAV